MEPAPPPPQVRVRRSARRRRTVSAYRDGDAVVVLIPDRFSPDEEREWVATMLTRLANKRGARFRSDEELLERALSLATRYLPRAPRPASVRWVTNQNSRWGSCTPADGTIRLSHRLRPLPDWVIDYVLIHELAHLQEPGHTPAFWRLVEGYPQAQRAQGFLEGIAYAPEAKRR
jgi:predicted metal-dependent hydrolase